MKKYNKILPFLTGFIFLLACGLYAHITTEKYAYDALDYYAASRSFVLSGEFALKNYNNTYRGYFFPFILYFFATIGECVGIPHWVSILIGNSLFASFTFTICLPNLLPDHWLLKNNLFLRLAPLVLIIIFWQDLVFYPLTDIYSFGVVLLIINVSLKIEKKWDIIIRGIIIGALFYCAYNIRTIYLFSAILYAVISIYDCCKRRIGYGRIALFYLSMACGAALSAYPQYIVNLNQHNVKSIAVITDNLNGGELFTSQLYMGMMFDRYETYMGASDVYPNVPVNFIDRPGVQIISNEQITGFDNLGQYVRIVLRHPIDYTGVIVRHIMSILYMPWNHIYIYDLTKWKMLFALLNYIVLCLFAIYTYQYIKDKGIKALFNRNMAYVSTILFPCAAIIFGAVEMRFFMPAYSFIYLIICMGDLHKTIAFIKKNYGKVIIAIFVTFCLLVGFWGGIMGNAQDLPQLLM